jgi:hypothetical protein
VLIVYHDTPKLTELILYSQRNCSIYKIICDVSTSWGLITIGGSIAALPALCPNILFVCVLLVRVHLAYTVCLCARSGPSGSESRLMTIVNGFCRAAESFLVSGLRKVAAPPFEMRG